MCGYHRKVEANLPKKNKAANGRDGAERGWWTGVGENAQCTI